MTYFLAKLLLNLSTKFATNFITIYITKFGDSQKSSLNLVKDFSQYFPLSMVSKKTHQDCHDICHQIWRFTKTVTKFGEKNHTLLITKHPSVPSSHPTQICSRVFCILRKVYILYIECAVYYCTGVDIIHTSLLVSAPAHSLCIESIQSGPGMSTICSIYILDIYLYTWTAHNS